MAEPAAGQRTRSTDVVHVDVTLLDQLLNLVGELVIHRASLQEIGKKARARHGFKEPVLKLAEASERLTRLSKDIQTNVIKARMVPIERLFQRFYGMLGDLSNASERLLQLEVHGEATEVDRKIADDLSEPLVHLVRNAVDHGIEPISERLKAGKPAAGTVTLNAFHDSNYLVIEVRDDGRGLDVERIKSKALSTGVVTAEEASHLDERGIIDLIFRTGFTTRDSVTALSGRGVGMDAARRRVESLGGTLAMEPTEAGSCARVRVPLTLAIIQALVVRAGSETYALPLENVRETVRAATADIRTVEHHEVLAIRGEALPLVEAAMLLDIASQPRRGDGFLIVVLRDGDERLGFIVDQVVGRQEIVIKPVPRRLTGISCLTGASIATDGSVFLILDVLGLCEATRALRADAV